MLSRIIRRAKTSIMLFIEKFQERNLVLPTHLDSYAPRTVVLPLPSLVPEVNVDIHIQDSTSQPLNVKPSTNVTVKDVLFPAESVTTSDSTSSNILDLDFDNTGSLIASWSLPPSGSTDSFLYLDDDIVNANESFSAPTLGVAEALSCHSLRLTPHTENSHVLVDGQTTNLYIVDDKCPISSFASLDSVDLKLNFALKNSGSLIASWSLPPCGSSDNFLYLDDELNCADNSLNMCDEGSVSRSTALDSVDFKLSAALKGSSALITSWSLPPSESASSLLYLDDDDLIEAEEAARTPILSPSLGSDTDSIDSSPPQTPSLENTFVPIFGCKEPVRRIDDDYKPRGQCSASMARSSVSTESLCLTELILYDSDDDLCALSLYLPSCDSLYDIGTPSELEIPTVPTITITNCGDDNNINNSSGVLDVPYTPSTAAFYELGLPITAYELPASAKHHPPIPIPFAPKLAIDCYICVPPLDYEEYSCTLSSHRPEPEEDSHSDLPRLGLRSTSGKSNVASNNYGFNWDRLVGGDALSELDLGYSNTWIGQDDISSTDSFRSESQSLGDSDNSSLEDLYLGAGAYTYQNEHLKESQLDLSRLGLWPTSDSNLTTTNEFIFEQRWGSIHTTN